MIATRGFQKRSLLTSVLLAAAGMAGTVQATAQTPAVSLVPNAVRFAGVGTNNRGWNTDSGSANTAWLNSPAGLAFDASGNLLIADSANNCVRKVNSPTAVLNPSQISVAAGLNVSGSDTCNASVNANPTPGQGLLNPSGVAADSNNNIYIADTGHNCVRQLLPGATGVANLITVAGSCGAANGSTTTPVPSALATDSAGNLYILTRDTTNNVYAVLEHVAGSSSGTVCRVAGNGNVALCSGFPTPPHLAEPSGVAVDGSNTLYIADTGNNCVRSEQGGTFAVAAGTCGSASSSVIGPTSIAFSRAGNMFISLSLGNQLLQYNQATGALQLLAGNPNGTPGVYAASQDGSASSTLPLNNPQGVAVDSNNNLYLADSGNSIVRELNFNTLFPATSVGAPSPQQVLTFEINATSNLTLTPGLDYSIAPGTDSCTGPQTAAAPGATPAFCKVNVIFTPTAPGNRFSGFVVADSVSGTRVSTGLQGVGSGPIAQLFPGAASVVEGGLGTVIYVDHDSSNRVYVLHASLGGQPELLIYPSGGGVPTVAIPQNTGMKTPTSFGIDAAGNIYVADTTGGTGGTPVIELFPSDGTAPNLHYVTGIGQPFGLSVDGSGNMLFAEQQGGFHDVLRVYAGGQRSVLTGNGNVVPSAGNQSTAEGAPASTIQLNTPSSVTTGPDGTIYISDSANRFVYSVDTFGNFHYIAGNGTTTTTAPNTALGQALVDPLDIEVDAAGDLYIADPGTNSVYVRLPQSAASDNLRLLLGNSAGTAGNNNGTAPFPASNNASITTPEAVTVTPDGLVYVAETAIGQVRGVTYPGAPAATVDFGQVAVGSQNQMSQFLWNSGNSGLLINGLPVLTNTVPPNSFTNDTIVQLPDACGGNVAGGLLCAFPIDFDPTSATVPLVQTGTGTVNDSGANSPQTFGLHAQVIPALITSFTAAVETEPYGGPYVGTVIVVTNGGTVPTGSVTFTINPGPHEVVCVTPPGPVQGTVSCTLPAGTQLPVSGSPYNVSVGFADTSTANYPPQHATTTLTETPRALTEIVNSKTKVYLQPNPILDGTPNGVLPGVGSDSFSVTYGYGATPITTTTPVGVYTGDIVATITPIGGTNAANYTITNTPGDFTITQGALLGFGAPPVTEAYGAAYIGTASFAVPTGGAAPGGTITFTDSNGHQLCLPQPAATTVTCSIPAGTGFHVGTYTVAVHYTGDTNYAAADATETLTVTPVPLTITVANQSKAFGTAAPSPISTATVTGLVNGDTVGHNILITLNNAAGISATTPIGTYPNAVTATTTGPAANSYTITTVPGSYVVGGITSTTALSASAATIAAGGSVTYTAVVTAPPGNAVPTGTVVFTSDGTTIGTITLDGTGTAALTTTSLTAGTHAIVATYGGNANFAGSSNSTSTVVTVPVGSLAITESTNTQLVRGPGTSTFTVTVTANNGFSGLVKIGCSGLPADATCALSATSVTLAANGSTTVTVTTTTTAADAFVSANRAPGTEQGWPASLAITAAAAFPMQLSGLGLLAAGVGRRKRLGQSKMRVLMLLLLAVGLLGLSGCGNLNTTFHTYPVTITATSVNGGPASVSTTMYLSVGQAQ